MRIMQEQELEKGLKYIEEAAKVARNATCTRAKCGTVIVSKDGEIIGRGFNSPAANLESQRRCSNEKSSYDKRVTDKTCCIHAEHRAIADALKNNSGKIAGSTLYFMRVDSDGNITFAGNPYCTMCSKMALDSGIKEFVLYHESGLTAYKTEEYNDISFNYKE